MSLPKPSPFRTPSAAPASPKPTLLPSALPRHDDTTDSTARSDRPRTALRNPSDPIPHKQHTLTADNHEEPPYPELSDPEHVGPSGSRLLPPPAFMPFFSLVRDTDTGEYTHPSVYYVFEDDDPEIMTTAALDAIQSRGPYDGLESATDVEVEDRYIVVNVAEDAQLVRAVASLSSRWAVTSAKLQAAPVFGAANTTPGDARDAGNLMLVVEGNTAPKLSSTDYLEETAKVKLEAGTTVDRRRDRVFESMRNRSGEQNPTTVMADILASMQARMAALEQALGNSNAR